MMDDYDRAKVTELISRATRGKELDEIERLKQENAELRERIKSLEKLAAPVGWGNEAEDKFVQEE